MECKYYIIICCFYDNSQEYLSRFGYIHNLNENPTVDVDETRQGIREFQGITNLIPNGRLNRRTILAMNKKRCGNRDARVDESDEIDDSQAISANLHPSVLIRRKRYDLQGWYDFNRCILFIDI